MSNAETPENGLLDYAVAAHNAGLCVLPPKQDGSKRPLKAWESYANQSSTIEEVHDWYGSGKRTGMGIVLGLASESMECFEFDDLVAYGQFLDLAEERGMVELVDRIQAGYLEESPNGIHWLYRCADIAGNTKLARRPKTESEKTSEHDIVKVLIETRGQGGYAIVAPSSGSVHPTGRPYRLLCGSVDTIATITPEEREALWNLARSMDQMPAPPAQVRQETGPMASLPSVPSNGDKPGDWFNRAKTWAEVLEPAGWTWVYDHGVESFWRRPGKDRDYSATTNYSSTDVLKCFSSSTPFDPEKSYTKFAAYAVLFHNGSYSDAARAISREMPREERHLQVLEGPARLDSSAPSDSVPAVEEVKVGSSWKRVDLTSVLTGETANMNQPEMLEREDGVLLLYPGRIHEFKGLPEAGKGWLALMACRQELRAGNTVLYVDLEDHAEGIVERLLAMGLSHQVIEQKFVYVHPDEAFGNESQQIFFALVRELQPSIAILDSVAEIMASNAMDPLSNKDAAEFIRILPRPLSLLGPAVVVIDHLTKQNDNTRFSIGAQHKLAAVDGASYVVEAEEPFGRGRRGVSRIAVVKDRPGHVRRHAEGGRYIGRLTVHANENGTLVDAQLGRPLSQTVEGLEASAGIMSEVAEYIESQGKRSPSTKEIREGVKGRNEVIDIALDTLVTSGYLLRENCDRRGGGKMYTSVKTFEG